MTLRPRNRSNSSLKSSEQNQIEEWWEGGSSVEAHEMSLGSAYFSRNPRLSNHIYTLNAVVDAHSPTRCTTSTSDSILVTKSVSQRKRTLPPPLILGSIAEEATGSEYYLDLGAESPMPGTPNLVNDQAFVEQWAAAGIAVPRAPTRRLSWRSLSSMNRERERSKTSKKDTVDRDCGICFEYAVVPCRTLCCGKIFCTEHLADWLHGANAEGRCPNCENACSLEGGTLSLATPSMKHSSKTSQVESSVLKPELHSPFPRSSPQAFEKNTSPVSRDQSSFSGSTLPHHFQPTTSVPLLATDHASSSATSSPTVSAAASIDATSSSDEEPNSSHKTPFQVGLSGGNLSTTPFSTSWGAVSRFMSIVTFLMFLYKLLS